MELPTGTLEQLSSLSLEVQIVPGMDVHSFVTILPWMDSHLIAFFPPFICLHYKLSQMFLALHVWYTCFFGLNPQGWISGLMVICI